MLPDFSSDSTLPEKRPISVTIHKSIEEVYRLLSGIQNLPTFMDHLENSVGDGNSPGEIVDPAYAPKDVFQGDNLRDLTWNALDGAGFPYTLVIKPETAHPINSTVLRAFVSYDKTAGEIASVLEKLSGEDAFILTRKNLQRLKAFCETGAVPTTREQPSGREEILFEPSDLERIKHNLEMTP